MLLPTTLAVAAMLAALFVILASGLGSTGVSWNATSPSEYSMALIEMLALVLVILAIVIGVAAIRTAQRREAALVATLARTEGTLAALGESVIRMDKTGRVNYLNPAARAMLGLAGDDVPETLSLVDPATRQPILPTMLDGSGNGGLISVPDSARLTTTQGLELEVEGSARAVPDGRGQIDGWVLSLRDVTEEREWTRRQPDLWDRDGLTSLPGRAFMVRRLTRVLERERAGDRPMAYIQIDVPSVRQVYSDQGSDAGDALVRQLLPLLQPHVRDTDLLGRLDVDVFGILLSLCPEEIAERIANQISATLAASHFPWAGENRRIEARVGRVQIPPFQGTVEDLFEAARHAR